MSAPEFVEIHESQTNRRCTINPRYVMKIEPAPEYNARIHLADGTNIVVEWSYEYCVQRVTGSDPFRL